ncbi:hypothetical protein DB88DRAFT_495114 [Papiliotrema laurentii]|uniref:Cytochrome c oxidase subunit 9, mitochondrial n=1 Tax=Papiliotrema laurentii TaxID=5418 RepID=A0AAD9CXW5_PAPLA|nr:hypothetical protein DB88DRAFT_495114 [Papiliotrema laurentii]
MAIAPIVGMLRKKLITDLSIALGLGTALGYGYWYGFHLPAMAKRDAFYVKYEQDRASS